MKLHLCFAGIALLLVVASATVAETETEQLKQVQELFQPLPRDMAMPGAPITPKRPPPCELRQRLWPRCPKP
jgi:hypothetical protein